MRRYTRAFGVLLIVSLVAFSNPAIVLLAEEAPADTTPPAETTTPPADTTPAPDTTTPPAADTTTPPAGSDGASTPAADTPAPDTTTPPAETPAADSPANPSPDTTITTGDATSGSDTTTTVNTNETSTAGSGASGSGGAAPTDQPAPTITTTSENTGSGGGVAASTNVTAENNNTASTSNNVTVGAETGDNTANNSSTTTPGNTSITTGNATAYANVVNVLNTNIFNSSGFFLFLNSFFGGGTLDLSNLSFMNPSGAPSGTTYCSLGGCDDENQTEYVAINNNNATIDNQVVVRANSGGNSATAGNGNASVQTGNAYAAANVVNVANTNFIDSNYLLLSFNNFGDMNGDVVLPNADFFSHLFGAGSTLNSGSSLSSNNTNTANVSNGVSANASSGNNTASANGGSASVVTGNASADGGVTNVVNTNEVGGTTVFLLFRVFGDWAGDVFNAPEGVQWAKTANGVQLFSADGSGNGLSALQNLNSTNSSTASITNDVHVYALTGDNQVNATNGNASVQTGNAYAAANVMNIANTNVIGRNWIYAVFNIFGNWNGNVSFGQPDLWVGAIANPQTSGELVSGTDVEYHFTVTNRGHANASNVHLAIDYDHNHLQFADGSSWDLGTLAPNQTVELVKHATIANLDYGDTPLPVNVHVTEHESDANPSDNQDEVTIVGQYYVTGVYFGHAEVSGIAGGAGYIDPVWKISKTASASTTVASSTVDYKVVVNNDGAPAYNATLFDTVTDQDGNIIFEQSWDLGTVPRGEEDTITYSVFFHDNIPSGVYTNHAFIKSQSRDPNPGKGVESDSPVATASVTILGDAPISISTRSCDQYIHKTIKVGQANDPSEVSKLQRFLADFGGFANVHDTGVYDQATQDAVRLFQDAHKDDVLNPWGLDGPTGYVYITTRKKINDIYCQGVRDFPLTSTDTTEISAYKGYLLSLRSSHTNRGVRLFGLGDGEDASSTDAHDVVSTSGPGFFTRTVDTATTGATNTSAAVINATEALGLMVTTTANAFHGIKGWVSGFAGSFGHILAGFHFGK